MAAGQGPGQQVVDDGTAFIDGMNARVHEDIANPSEMPEEYPALQLVPQDWKPTDLVAMTIYVTDLASNRVRTIRP